MPLTPSFTASQLAGSPNSVLFADTSTGTDVTITYRRIYFTTVDGTDLADAASWAYADTTKTITDLLTRSTAGTLVVKWFNAANVAVYTVTSPTEFSWGDDVSLYEIGQQAMSNPSTLQDTNWLDNFFRLIANNHFAEKAISVGGSIVNSQEALNRNYNMIQNQSMYF